MHARDGCWAVRQAAIILTGLARAVNLRPHRPGRRRLSNSSANVLAAMDRRPAAIIVGAADSKAVVILAAVAALAAAAILVAGEILADAEILVAVAGLAAGATGAKLFSL